MNNEAIVFGAGEIGIKVKKIFEDDGYQVVCFCDNNKSKWGRMVDGIKVYPADELLKRDYDIVGIGALKAAETIKNQLIESGVEEKKIKIPIVNKKLAYNDDIIQVDKVFLEREQKIDLYEDALKLLIFKLIRDKVCYSKKIDRFLEIIIEYFEIYDKQTFNDKIEQSITRFSYRSDYNSLVNDIVKYVFKADVFRNIKHKKLTLNELFELSDDKELHHCLMSEYFCLSDTAKIVTVWNSNNGDIDVENHFRDMKTVLLTKIKYDFEDNYNAYISCLKVIQNKSLEDLHYLQNDMVEILKFNSLSISFFIVDNIDSTINVTTIDNEWMYWPKNSQDSERVFKNLFHKESFRMLSYRYPKANNRRFIDMLNELEDKMNEFNVSISDVCVVGGGVFETLCARRATDIDLIIRKPYRKKYGNGLIIVSDNVEIHHANEFDVEDDLIINNPENHFYFHNIKFMSVDILYRKRKKTNSTDARLLELMNIDFLEE